MAQPILIAVSGISAPRMVLPTRFNACGMEGSLFEITASCQLAEPTFEWPNVEVAPGFVSCMKAAVVFQALMSTHEDERRRTTQEAYGGIRGSDKAGPYRSIRLKLSRLRRGLSR